MSALLSSAISIHETLKPRILPVLNLIAFLILVLINILGSVGAFGETNASISKKYDTLITPAGFAFSIWGLIYFMVAVFVLINWIIGFLLGLNNHLMFKQVGYFFIVHCIFPSLWTFSFNFEFLWTSTVFMVLYFVSIVIIYLRIECSYDYFSGLKKRMVVSDTNCGVLWRMKWKKSEEQTHEDFENISTEEEHSPEHIEQSSKRRRMSIWEFLFVQIPFSLQLGWISIALIANIAIAFKGYLAPQQLLLQVPDSTWSIIVQTIAVCLSFLIIYTRNDFVYTGVVTWALYAVAVKQSPTPVVSSVGWCLGSVSLLMTLFGISKLFYDIIVKDLLVPRFERWLETKK